MPEVSKRFWDVSITKVVVLMELKGAIFDLDGVIVDTVPMHYQAWKRLFSEVGMEFNLGVYRTCVDGIPRIEGIRNMMPDINEEELKRLAERKQRYYLEQLDVNPPKIFDDANYFIGELKSHAVKIAVASSSKNCLDILKRIEMDGIDAVIDGNDFKRGKPDPEIFLKAAGKMRLGPANCMVVEDAILGVKAAKAAEMRCIMIRRKKDMKESAGADWVVDSLRISYEQLIFRFSGENQ